MGTIAEKKRFIAAMGSMADTFDFIHGDGGSGAEFICIYLSNNCDRYIPFNDNTSGAWMSYNRFGYKERFMKNFFLTLGMHSINFNTKFDTWGEVYEGWDIMTTRNMEVRNNIIEGIEGFKEMYPGKRILCRTHDAFYGFEKLFPNSDSIHLKAKNEKWLMYRELLVGIKVMGSETGLEGDKLYTHLMNTYDTLARTENSGVMTPTAIINKSQGWMKPTEFLSRDEFSKRIKIIIDSDTPMNTHYPIALMMPERVGASKEEKKSLLDIEPFLLNSKDWYWNTSYAGHKYKRRMKFTNWFNDSYNPEEWNRAGKYFCLSEYIFEDDFALHYNIDPIKFHKAIFDWHEKNMDLIYETEIYLEEQLLKPDINYFVK